MHSFLPELDYGLFLDTRVISQCCSAFVRQMVSIKMFIRLFIERVLVGRTYYSFLFTFGIN